MGRSIRFEIRSAPLEADRFCAADGPPAEMLQDERRLSCPQLNPFARRLATALVRGLLVRLVVLAVSPP
jgi:hypothetical protein